MGFSPYFLERRRSSLLAKGYTLFRSDSDKGTIVLDNLISPVSVNIDLNKKHRALFYAIEIFVCDVYVT